MTFLNLCGSVLGMQSFLDKYRRGNVAVTLAYSPSPELTFIDVDIPHIVPLYHNFDVNKPIGSGRLVAHEDGIYTMFEVTPAIKGAFRDLLRRGEVPNVVFAVSGGERMVKNGVNFVRGGAITAASLCDLRAKSSEEVADDAS